MGMDQVDSVMLDALSLDACIFAWMLEFQIKYSIPLCVKIRLKVS